LTVYQSTPPPALVRDRRRSTFRRLVASIAASTLLITACSAQAGTGTVAPSLADPGGSAGSGVAPSAAAPQGTLKLGYFPNITHATAIVGVESGIFQKALGPGVTFTVSSFNAGPAASEALLNGAIDATFIGPNPAINAFAKSNGAAIRIIAGATSGGAYLVVKPEITSAAGLRGKKVASPTAPAPTPRRPGRSRTHRASGRCPGAGSRRRRHPPWW
jgi:NitT/TauT family transport system substrate-binding protein